MFSRLIITSRLLNNTIAPVDLLNTLLQLGLHLLYLRLEDAVGVVELLVLVFKGLLQALTFDY